MTQDEIIRMARTALRLSVNDESLPSFDAEKTILNEYEFLYWFAKEVAAAEREKFKVHVAALVRDARHDATEREREACAKVCDSLHDKIDLVEKTEHYPGEYGSEYDAGQGNAICECADAIRARGNQE